MTYKEWEKKLSKYLKPLVQEERFAAVEYYREMYGDKLEAGLSCEEILEEFGSPQACAERILGENGLSLPQKTKNSVGWWVGISFLTLILILPLYASLFSIVISFGAVAFSGGASALAGGIYVVASPFLAIEGMSFWGVIAHMGMGFVALGVGLLLMIGFAYLTKYLYKWTMKSLGFIYKRR
jgi:uncharacterized membrane protein